MHPETPYPRGRGLAIALFGSGAVVLASLAIAGVVGVRINATDSMPRGLWRVRSNVAIERGEIVTVCPPDRTDIREAVRRGYIPNGGCAGGYEPLVKPIAAIAGDLVTVTSKGVAVDGTPVTDTRQLARDEAGRPLHPMPLGSYRVPAGEIWLLSGHDPRSFDSRYFGPVPAKNVQGVARPLWVLR
jgi:conjugative transfer signal peptidase TraF